MSSRRKCDCCAGCVDCSGCTQSLAPKTMTATISGLAAALGADYAPYDNSFTLTADNCIWKYCEEITISGSPQTLVIMGFISLGVFSLVAGYSSSSYDCSGDANSIDTILVSWTLNNTECLWYTSQTLTESGTSTGATATITSDTQSCDDCPECSDGVPSSFQIDITSNWSNFFCSNCASLIGTYVLTRRCLCSWVYNFSGSDVCNDAEASESNPTCDRGTLPRLSLSMSHVGSDLVATITYQSVSNGTLGTATVTLTGTYDCNAFADTPFSLAAVGVSCSGFAAGKLTAL